MLNSTHPDDERLSALASGDDDATTDAALSSHITTCDRCTELVNDLGALRLSLAALPDLEPSRPLRLLPPVDGPAADAGIGAWARRLFAPALTAGAALAMVGLIGTASPALQGMASGGGDSAEAAGEGGDYSTESEFDAAASEAPAAAPDEVAASAAMQEFGETDGRTAAEEASAAPLVAEDDASRATELPGERSPWPMVLFSGVALMIGAALLRWILVPRAG